MFLLDQWKKVLNKLENEVTAVTFDLWINTLTPIQYANDELILLAPSIVRLRKRPQKLCLQNF